MSESRARAPQPADREDAGEAGQEYCPICRRGRRVVDRRCVVCQTPLVAEPKPEGVRASPQPGWRWTDLPAVLWLAPMWLLAAYVFVTDPTVWESVKGFPAGLWLTFMCGLVTASFHYAEVVAEVVFASTSGSMIAPAPKFKGGPGLGILWRTLVLLAVYGLILVHWLSS